MPLDPNNPLDMEILRQQAARDPGAGSIAATPVIGRAAAATIATAPDFSLPSERAAGRAFIDAPFPSEDNARAFSGSGRGGRLALAQLKQAADEQFKERDLLLRESEAHATRQQKDFTFRTEQRVQADAADFFPALQEIRINDPDREAKISALAAQYPMALSHPAVKEALSTQAPLRETYLKTAAEGGPAAFPAAAQDVYQRELRKPGGTVFTAKAAATKFAKGEEEVTKAFAAGDLTSKDLELGLNPDGSPATVQTTTNPHFRKTDGEVDHAALLRTAAGRAGTRATAKHESEAVTKEERTIAQARTFIENYAKNPELAQDSRAKELNDIYMTKVLEYEKSKMPAGSTAAPAPAAPAAANKPKEVTQGGHIYKLQSDGSYK